MTISVVIPVYNGEQTIAETIKSVLNQNFKDIEVIVINDGSTDKTVDIVQNIFDSRLQIFSYDNSGLAATRNRGIKKARGKFISFIDADDLWTLDKLEDQYQVLKANPRAVLAYSWTDYINDSGNFIKAGRRIKFTGWVYERMLMGNFLENGSNPLIRRQVFEEVGHFDESLSAAEDWDMWLRICANHEFVCVQKPQILYRISANSMSNNLKKQEAESLKVIDRAFIDDKAQQLQHLKKTSLANLYKYLTFKAIEAAPNKQQTRIALRFWWNFINNSSSLRQQWRIILIAAVKIIFPHLCNILQKKKYHNLSKKT
ncbi:glycosyltransferase [Mastigocoleus sp. MO_188.B34]|uniref:glycosyltransferase n=1 Tax=Mastigocoleus sp. MO_188.B34 TaxID=3036635 RepID=UPI0026230A45|nr:glycosyltransferase [Mastigocoleus sp. MO_188.B34]MDJ0696185.1 glycosyltransferase [Mastigocoleus sp. MO_188.B34]